MDAATIPEAHLAFGGMDIDIHRFGIELEIEHKGGLLARFNKVLIRHPQGMIDELVARRPAIHIEVLQVGFRFNSGRRFWIKRKPTSNRLKAIRRMTCCTCKDSVCSVRRNLRRAGVLKKSSRISTVVPSGCGVGSGSPMASRPSVRMSQPMLEPRARDAKSSREIEPILGSASPRKPRVETCSRS